MYDISGVGLGFIMHVVVEPGIRNSNRNAFCRGIADADQLFWKEYLDVRLFVEGQKEKINRENSIIKNFYQESV